MKPKLISSKLVYRGAKIKLKIKYFRKAGASLARDVVEHPGACAVVAVDTHGRLLLMRQFRYTLQRFLYEVPAGTLDKGEAPLRCAKRELEEEAGLRGKRWTALGRIAPSPGVMDEMISIFLARGLRQCETALEEDELIIEYKWVTLRRAKAMIRNGKIQDAKTMAAIQLYELRGGAK